MLYSGVLSHLGQSPCAQIHPLIEQGSFFAGGRMQRVHRKGSEVLSACYKVGYSATWARAHVHRFILCSENRENRGLLSLRDTCREFIAKDHMYYLNGIK